MLCTSRSSAWLFFADDGAAEDEVTIRQDDGPYGYQLAATLYFLIFTDNLVCDLLFWSRIAPAGNPRIR
jgi:hypothetical protein